MKVTCSLLILYFALGFCYARIEFDIYKSEPSGTLRSKRSLNPNDLSDDESVVLFKFLNGEYYGLIGVGSPSKTFKVIFDTTWSDTWLPSSHCAWTEIVCQLHNKYDSSASSSYIPNGTYINMTGNKLSLSGILSTDTFHLPHVKVVNQTFLEATHISLNPFIGYRADGILGLAFQEQSGWDGVTPFFINMIQQKVVKEGIFTFYMNRDETTLKAGKIILGGTQRSHVKNNTIRTLPVVEKKFWKIKVDNILIEKNKTIYKLTDAVNATFDSSVNTISGPQKYIIELNYMLNAKFVPGLNKFSVNCRQYAKLPLVHFVFGGYNYIIQSKYYVQRITLDSVEACFSPFIINSNPNSMEWEFGGAFMMEFYTEFDMDNGLVTIGETIF